MEDNIYRFYGKKDPSLRKIIRNIKLAVRNRNSKHSVCYNRGYLVIDPGNGVNRSAAPLMPGDYMQLQLSYRISADMQIPEILVEVIDIIDQQQEYRKQFSVVTLAFIIRKCFVLLHHRDDGQESVVAPEAESQLLNKEFDKYLHRSVEKVNENIGSRYVDRGKVNREELGHYLRAASEIVRDDFRKQQTGFSQFDRLKQYVDGLDYDQFRRQHRPVMEYLVKQIRKELLDSLWREWTKEEIRC